MADWNPFDNGGATPVTPAPSTPAVQPAEGFDPFRDGGAQKLSTPADTFDPFKAGASLTDPEQIKSRVATDPSYTPNSSELRSLYDQEQNQTTLQKAGDLIKGVGEGVGQTLHSAVISPVKGIGEFAQDPSAGRLAATALEGTSGAASGVVGMVAKPILKSIQDEKTNPLRASLKKLNYLVPFAGSYLADKFAPDTQAQTQQRFSDWSQDYLTKLAVQRGPGIAKSFVSTVSGLSPEQVPAPYPELTRATELAASVPMMEAGIRALPLKGLSAEAAAPVTEAGLAAKTIAGTGKAVSATGKAMAWAGGLPEDFANWVTKKISGSPELADKLGKYVDVGEKLSVPLAVVGGAPLVKAIAAVKVLEGAGKVTEGLGNFASRLAEADPTQPLGRLYALAQDTTAPQWMRELASSPVVKLAAKSAGLAGDAVKGAASGAAFGGATSLASGDNAEETGASIGAGATFGAGFGVLHGPAADLREKQLGALANFLQAHLDAGISPETLTKVSSWDAMQAATAEKLSKGGQKIRFATAQDASSPFAPGGAAEGQAGWADEAGKTFWVDPTKRAVSETVLHEFFHGIWDSQVANHPEIAKAFDQALKADGKTLDDAKAAYVNAELGYTNDPAAIQARVAQRDAANPNWVYSELLSDAAGRGLYGQDLVKAAKPSLAQKVFGQGATEKGGTIFKGFEKVLDNKAVSRLALRSFRDYVDFRPGIDASVEKQVKLTPQDMGGEKAPMYQLPDGREINPYGTLVNDGKGGKKFVAFPASEVRRRLKTEQVALDKYFPKGQNVAQVPDAFWNDADVAPWTKEALKKVVEASKSGAQAEGWYHRLNKENSATSDKSWAADVARSAGNVAVSLQSGFPLTIKRSKHGNLLVDWASMEAARQKAPAWAARHGDVSLDLWGSDLQKFFADSQRYLQNHKEGQPGESNGIGQQKRDVLNAFWFGANKEFASKNPLRSQLRKADRAGIFRSLRVDRLETLHPVESDFSQPNWEKGKQNLSPAANGDGARLTELSTKTDRTQEEDTELSALQAKSAQNNSREAFMKLWQRPAEPAQAAGSVIAQAAAEHEQFSPSEDPRAIAAPAVEDADGKIYTGSYHGNAIDRANALKAKKIAGYSDPSWDVPFHVGYVTNEGEFLSRADAFKRAVELKQLSKDAPVDEDGVHTRAFKDAGQFSPRASKSIDNKAPDDIKSGRMNDKDTLPYSVGKPLQAFHYSDAGPGLDSVDPAFMRAKTTKFWGKTPKTFLWPKGSEQPMDSQYGNGKFPNTYVYKTKLDGRKIYDATSADNDPLGYFDKWHTDKEAIDKVILKNGYNGVLVSTLDGRQVVVMFEKAPAKLVGVTDDDGNIKTGRKKLFPAKPKTKFVAPKTDYSQEDKTDYANDDWNPDRDLPKPNLPKYSPEAGRKEGNEEVKQVARGYMKEAGFPASALHAGYSKVDPDFANRVADFYEEAQHDPEDPAVQKAYKAFSNEIRDQWDYITAQGMKMEPWTGRGQPYKDSKEMMADVRKDKHLWFFPTDSGFGSTDVATHPLLTPSGVEVDGRALLMNDLFRAVHDYFGHAKEGYEFGPRGEFNAYLAHSGMFSEAAKPAMAAETLGQNSWVNFGPHLRDAEGKIPAKGEKGFISPMERPFAEQKATLLPQRLMPDQQFSPSADPRAIKAAAVRDEEGKVYDGLHHGEAATKYWDTKFPGDLNNELRAWNSTPGVEEGFVTNSGEFLNRDQAYQRAVELKQYAPTKTDDGQLESTRFDRQQKLKAAGYDPAVVNNFSPMYDLDSIAAMNDAAVAKSRAGEKSNDDPAFRESSYLRSGKGIVLHSASLRSTTFIKGRTADSFEKKYTALQSKPARNALIESFFSPAAEDADKPAPVFYSQLDKTVEQKFSGKQMPAAQLAAILRNPQNGVKADELKWSGLDDFLRGKQRVTKEEIQQFLKENQLQVKEVTKGAAKLDLVLNQEETDHKGTDEPVYDVVDRETGRVRYTGGKPDAMQYLEEEAQTNKGTKFKQYQLPGGENYREILFTLPSQMQSYNAFVDGLRAKYGAGGLGNLPLTAAERAKLDKFGENPDADESTTFKSSHFDEPNVLAHTRVNDRADSNGKPGLFVEEIQSDWHQKGRKEGYVVKLSPEEKELDDLIKRIGLNGFKSLSQSERARKHELVDAGVGDSLLGKSGKKGVPDAPFKNTWQEFVFRRLVRLAAEQGKDWLGWTTGEQQAVRYDLSKHFDRVAVEQLRPYQSSPDVPVYGVNAYDKSGKLIVSESGTIDKLPDYIGKELADKAVSELDARPTPVADTHKRLNEIGGANGDKPGTREFMDLINRSKEGRGLRDKLFDLNGKSDDRTVVYSGLDLKVGGEGMKGFYDKILVDYANKFGKKFGARVEERKVPGEHDASRAELFTDRAKAVRVLNGGGEVYALFKGVAGETLVKSYQQLLELEKENDSKPNGFYLGDSQPAMPIHSLPITPEMKASVLQQGVSLFSPAAEKAPEITAKAGEKAASGLDEKAIARYSSRITAETVKNGGASFNVATGKNLGATKAPVFVVSIYPDRSLVLDPKEVTPERVGQFIQANSDLLANKENNVGTWNDPESGKVYLDVSWATPDRALAEYGGWKFNQKAIWDLKKSENIPTGGTGEAPEQMAPAGQRLDLLKQEYALQNPQSGQQQMPGMGRVVLNPRSAEVQNVRDLEAVRPDRALTPTEQAASDLARQTLRKQVQLLPTVDDKVKVRRAFQKGLPEVVEFLGKQATSDTFDSGKEWYRKDIAKMEETTKTLFPATKDANKMQMFKVLLAAFSGGATPKENYQLAAEAFAHYLKTGEVPATSDFRISETGQAKKLGRQATMTADKLSKMIETLGGEANFVKYLTEKHAETILGNKDAYGALDLGPKFGRFFLNLTGHAGEVTVDLWATRTWQRWMGTPFSRVQEAPGKTKMAMPDIPTDAERNSVIEAFHGIAQEINKTLPAEKHIEPMDVQAMLWFYEKDLYAARGVKVDRGSFSEGAREYAKKPLHLNEKPVITGAKRKVDPNQLQLMP